MAVKTNSELAAFFETGDQPSETEFGHLIDTIQPSSVLLADDDVNFTVADNAFRLNIMPNISANRTITLPTPVLDVWFHIVYLPLAADTDNLTIEGTTAHSFYGGVIHSDTNLASAGDTDVVFGDGSADDAIVLAAGKHLDIWLHGKSTTVWYVWGVSAGDTVITIE